jgi:DNA-binding NtrC family response regulator
MASPKPPVIFVVNSSEETVDALRNCFEDEGFNTASMHVDEIRKGSEDVVAFIAQHAFDVAVWDVAPPYDHNWNFLKLVRKAFPELPFVVTTTNKSGLDKMVGQKTETIELLGKPYDLEQILGAVKRALKR